MDLIDFNSENFNGFTEGEEILIDTGVLLGFLNTYDDWHDTVSNLFSKEIIGNDKTLFLCVNPNLVNEVQHIANNSVIKDYLRNHPEERSKISKDEINKISSDIKDSIKELIEEEVLLVLDGDKQSVLKQLELGDKLGAADALNASIANEYGINLLTVDTKLVRNIDTCKDKLPNLPKVYYTTSEHMKAADKITR